MSEYDRLGERILDSGTRVRWYISVERGKERIYHHHECERRAETARRAFERWFARAVKTRSTYTEADMNDFALEELRRQLDRAREYLDAATEELDRLAGRDRREERIRQLRQVAGRTPAERAAYLAKADELERAL